MSSVMSVRMQEAQAKADAYDQTLLATDPRFHYRVQLVHGDGTVLHFNCAFLMTIGEDWIVAFTEHHGCHVYHVEDLDSYAQMQMLDIEPLV